MLSGYALPLTLALILLPILMIVGIFRLFAFLTARRNEYHPEAESQDVPPRDRVFSEHEPREPEPQKNRKGKASILSKK